jgi:hypothetical protein
MSSSFKRRGGIPRKTLPAKRNVEVRNEFNEVTSITETNFQALHCTVQPYEGDMFTPDVLGYTDKDVFTVFTETELKVGQEGTNRKPDEVMIEGKWFKVVKVKRWQTLLKHYEVVVIEKDEGLL